MLRNPENLNSGISVNKCIRWIAVLPLALVFISSTINLNSYTFLSFLISDMCSTFYHLNHTACDQQQNLEFICLQQINLLRHYHEKLCGRKYNPNFTNYAKICHENVGELVRICDFPFPGRMYSYRHTWLEHLVCHFNHCICIGFPSIR